MNRRTAIVVGGVLVLVLVAALVAVVGSQGGSPQPTPTGTAAAPSGPTPSAATPSATPVAPASAAPASQAPASVAPGSAVPTAATVTGDPLPDFQSPAGDAAVGLPAPEVDGSDFHGQPVVIRNDGRPKLIVFLAHWCPHCQREVPVIQAWLNGGGQPDGVDIISVVTSIDSRMPNYPPDAWLAREGWTVPVIVDLDNRVSDAYGLTAFPYFVGTDAAGRIVGRVTGELPVEQLEAIVNGLAAP